MGRGFKVSFKIQFCVQKLKLFLRKFGRKLKEVVLFCSFHFGILFLFVSLENKLKKFRFWIIGLYFCEIQCILALFYVFRAYAHGVKLHIISFIEFFCFYYDDGL